MKKFVCGLLGVGILICGGIGSAQAAYLGYGAEVYGDVGTPYFKDQGGLNVRVLPGSLLYESTAFGTASSSILMPYTGGPDLSASAFSTAQYTSSNATAIYRDTITFNYTGSGTPTTLSDTFNWAVNVRITNPNSDVNSIATFVSLYDSNSNTYFSEGRCPVQVHRYRGCILTSSNTYTFSIPFTVANGDSLGVYAAVEAVAYSDLANLGVGSASVDPQLSLVLPLGWRGTLASGGTIGGSGLAATPEPPTFWLMATGILGMFGWAGYRRMKAQA